MVSRYGYWLLCGLWALGAVLQLTGTWDVPLWCYGFLLALQIADLLWILAWGPGCRKGGDV